MEVVRSLFLLVGTLGEYFVLEVCFHSLKKRSPVVS